MAHHEEEIAPRTRIRTEESTANHWVGSCETLVMLVLHEGSHADPTHVRTAQRTMVGLLRQGHQTLQLLVVWPPTLGKPPSAEVRRAIVEAAPIGRSIDRVAGVILGTGFLAAMHRSAVTGIFALTRAPVSPCIVDNVADAVAHVARDDARRAEALTRFCEGRVAHAVGPAPSERTTR